MRLVLASALLLALGAGTASAACKQADLAGKWVITPGHEREICAITVEAKEGEFTGTCRIYSDKGKVEDTDTAEGVIEVSKGCKITGKIETDDTVRSFSGRTEEEPSTIVGIIFRHGLLTGFKQ